MVSFDILVFGFENFKNLRYHRFISCMFEGTLAEDLTAKLNDILTRLSHVYHRHILIEDRKIFPFAKKVLNSSELSNLSTQMAARRRLR